MEVRRGELLTGSSKQASERARAAGLELTE
jgi:hypothetical protein